MGRKPKYKSDEDRKAAAAQYQRERRARMKERKAAPVQAKTKSKGNPSWLKKLTGKLEESVEPPSEPTESAPLPETPGEPFADLPKVTLPGASPESETDGTASADTPSAGNPTASAEAGPTSSSTDDDKPRIEVDNKELAKMAGEMVKGATLAAGAYAAERGFFAWGPDMADIAGKAAAVIVRAHATRLDISSEEGAAYVILGITGTNGVQAFRAYLDEKRKKDEAKAHEKRAAGAVVARAVHANGVAPGAPAQQAAADAAAAARRVEQGPVV
jgi:hypothetical protein